jgi:hypothetical protein
MMHCEYNGCRRFAEYHRPQLIDGAYNNLCHMCFERIYHGYPNYKAAWEKLTQALPVNTFQVNIESTPNEQPTLF